MSRISGTSEAALAAACGAPSVRRALASLSLCMLLPALGTSIANVALPTFTQAFGASFGAVQWVVLAYLLANTTLIVGAGRLGDLLGRRRLLLIGLVLFTVASLLCAAAPTLALLIAARAVQGVGAALLMALGMALVGETVPKKQAGRAMGLLGTTSAIGTALGPSLGGLLIAAFGWPALFLLSAALGLPALWLAWRYLPASRPASDKDRPGFDLPGTLLLAATLAAYALAMTLGRGRFGLLNAALLLGAALGLALFLWVQARSASPLVRLARLRDPVLGAGLALSVLVSAVVMATLVVGPFYLAGALGLASAAVGLVMSAGPVLSALAGVPSGRLVDRLGARRMSMAGLLGMAAGCVALCLVPAAWGVAGYVLAIAMLTPGYALFQAANNTAVMNDVPAEQRGVISGLLNLSRNLGLVTGASVMGSVFAFGSGALDLGAAPPQALTAGLRATFGVAAVLLVAALGIAAAKLAHRRPGARCGA
ncbi:MFS transporter [Azohydromonas caseinilytica]|nr:MFS transporter [Azohydromonas caseinilytica]